MIDPNHKPLSDPTYTLSDFRLQLLGGRLRWFATLLALVATGFFLYLLLTDPANAELDFPIHLNAPAARWTVGLGAAFWSVIAIINWKSWLRKPNTPTDTPPRPMKSRP